MFIGLTKACHHLQHHAIPALLLLYQVKTVQALPPPIRGEVLFIKGVIAALQRRNHEEHASEASISILFAAVKLFVLRFPGTSDMLGSLLIDGKHKQDCFFEAHAFEYFIHFIFSMLLNKTGQESLLRNSDAQFDGDEIFSRALMHRNELLRVVLLKCFAHQLPIQQMARAPVDHEKLFSEALSFGLFSLHEPITHPVFHEQLKDIDHLQTDKHHVAFLKAAFQHLRGEAYPDFLKYWMLRGVILVVDLQLKSMPATQTSSEVGRFIQQQLRHLKMNQITPLDEWKASFAVFLFCKANLFKQARPEKGLLALPFFGLGEREIYIYWQSALQLMTVASQHLFRSEQRFQSVCSALQRNTLFGYPSTAELNATLKQVSLHSPTQ